MFKSVRVGMLLLTALLAAGCAGCRIGAPRVESQSFSTQGVLRVDLGLSDHSSVSILAGAIDSGREDAPAPKGKGALSLSASAGMMRRTAAKVTIDQSGDTANASVPLVESAWIYVVRPPAWPVVRTPATRGGVPVSFQWNGSTQVGAAVDGGVERIFFLGAFNTDGTERPTSTRLVVDDYPAHPSNPPEVELAVGEYAEARLVGDTLQIVKAPLPITDPNCPQEIKDLISQMRQYAIENGLPWNPAMVPAGAAGGGVGGSS